MLLNPYRFGGPPSALLTGLVSYWRLDEASGNAIDSHGTNHLTNVNAVGTAAGKIGSARDFESSNAQHFSVTSVGLTTGDIDFSMSCWVRIESLTGSNMSIIGKWAAGQEEYFLYMAQETPRVFALYVYGSGGQFRCTGNANDPVIGQWYHIIAWHDSVLNQLGVVINNGPPNVAAHTTGVIARPAQPFYLGRSSTGNYWDGLIDEVGFWSRVLTPAERAELYDGLTYPFVHLPPETGSGASGGVIRTVGNFKVHTFNVNGTFSVTEGTKDVQFLIVGGGGAGGRIVANGNGGGGGGAGQVLVVASHILPVGDYPVSVGAGGISTLYVPDASHDGMPSSVAGFTAIGGGAGHGAPATTGGGAGRTGASGGGACGLFAGGVGTAGNSGGSGLQSGSYSGGGGGGAGGAGANGSATGNGGAGVSNSITGTAVFYGGGGGAGKYSAAGGTGGTGGGGDGAPTPGSGQLAGLNTGGGGGGAGSSSSTGGFGSTGGSGVVIIRYQFQ